MQVHHFPVQPAPLLNTFLGILFPLMSNQNLPCCRLSQSWLLSFCHAPLRRAWLHLLYSPAGETWRHWLSAQTGPEEGHKVDQRAGAPPLWGQAERVGGVQPGEGKAPGRPCCGLPVKGAYRKDGEGLLIRECSDRMRGNCFKLKEGRLRLGLKKKFFTMKVMRRWNMLPKEAVDASSLAVFKARLDGALSNLV